MSVIGALSPSTWGCAGPERPGEHYSRARLNLEAKLCALPLNPEIRKIFDLAEILCKAHKGKKKSLQLYCYGASLCSWYDTSVSLKFTFNYLTKKID